MNVTQLIMIACDFAGRSQKGIGNRRSCVAWLIPDVGVKMYDVGLM